MKSEENRRRLSELCTRDKNINLMSKWVDCPPEGAGGWWSGIGVKVIEQVFTACVFDLI